MKAKNHKKSGNGFVICVENRATPVSLEKGKVYRTLPDAAGTKHGYIRVVDESGEDYLYPQKYFLPIALTRAVQRALKLTS